MNMLCVFATVVMIFLKLVGVIAWSWWIVGAPVLLGLIVTCLFSAMVFMSVLGQKDFL